MKQEEKVQETIASDSSIPTQSPNTLLHVHVSEEPKNEDSSNLIAKDIGIFHVNHPEASEWECQMFGCHNSIVWRPNKGEVPNWFLRWMQYRCFGNKWRKWK